MNYRSVCSGIEAATVAWEPLGFRALSFSEIEPFPCSVLAHRFPNVPNLGDMTRFAEWSDDDPTDVLVGGTPCQSFSVAGLRKGMRDPRGSLALAYCGILDRFKPRWFVWENVPGVLSSWSGDDPPSDLVSGQEWKATEESDFGQLLEAFSELGYGYAWSVRDAQYFGVPQRRRRVFVVGHLGNWRRAAAVLFEPESLCGNPAKGSKKREDIAGTLASRTSGGGGLGTDFECGGGVIPAITTRPYADRESCEGQLVVSNAEGATSFPFLTRSNVGKCVNNQTPLVYQCHGSNVGEMGTLRAKKNESCGVPFMPVAFNPQAGGKQTNIGYDETRETTGTVERHQIPGVHQGHAVRRLTPRECERLQGFPDDWTLVPHRGNPAADGPRYKAIGNSMAVPVMAWIGRRIQQTPEEMR